MLNSGLNELLSYKRKNKLHVINIGLKVFTKNKGNQVCEVGFRLLQEGLGVLLPHMGRKRVVEVTRELFFALKKKSDHMLTFEELKSTWQVERFE